MTEEHRFAVDRFEGELAVVEVDGQGFLDLPRWLLPAGCRPDDVVRVRRRTIAGGAVAVRLRVDREATEQAREEARRLIEELRQRDPGGDLTL